MHSRYSPLSAAWLASVRSHLRACLFILFTMTLGEHMFLMLMGSNLSGFPFVDQIWC